MSHNINYKGCVFQPIIDENYFKRFVNVTKGRGEKESHVFHIQSYFLIPSYSNSFIVLHYPKPILMVTPNEYNNRQKILNTKPIVTNRYAVVVEESDENGN